jgi:deoxyribodipyrimidine photo-lyase
MPVSIWWIRRDLRLADNSALLAARQSGYPVLPVFILDDRLMTGPFNRRQRFLVNALADLRLQLQQEGSDLLIRTGRPEDVLTQLYKEMDAAHVYAERDYSTFARIRDDRVSRVIPLTLTGGLTIHPPEAVLKPDGSPYTIFTPFSRRWLTLPLASIASSVSGEFLPADRFPSSDPLPEYPPVDGFPATHEEAEKRVATFMSNGVDGYASQRDRMDLDGTSGLSPYLRFGLLSVGRLASVNHQSDKPISEGRKSWLNELIWRDFYHSILFNFPFVIHEAFQPKFRHIPWRDAPRDLQAWKDGLTGYPVVDATMRQLKVTGWMHNRARMITASFLTKDLLINWQEGERWFMDQLVDGDPAANNGGWQWAAGTGTDAAPYFRIFNPVLQGKRFDPLGAYIRRWVPELRNLPDHYIHEPWTIPPLEQASLGISIGRDYPLPIVDHSIVRERALAAYRASAG